MRLLDAQVKLQHFLQSYNVTLEIPVECSKFQIKFHRQGAGGAQFIGWDSKGNMSKGHLKSNITLVMLSAIKLDEL